ncbi:MAG: S-layer homology domain-containing protein [Sedimentibacter sp.]|uniref:S-layer homology domain-containing protein n=1 Tax=Sedimentibacter sp. TaxID=1960295 RepID=UPI0029818A94|nr:S-layer homology domain-containing protein [Sedimentibacter sp.]MDW5299174.1 S-layer homology domain-containing protein [Sedimentibacter sp.]
MKNIIMKITVLGLCIVLATNMNVVAHASVLDAITGETTDVEENQETSENMGTSDFTFSAETIDTSYTFSDIEEHWAKNWINEAVELGFVSGYEDGTFKPDRTITRAEFSKLLNNAMHIENAATLNFSDVSKSDWFYNEVQKSVASGFFSGYENNTFRPNNPIRREEVAKVVSNTITSGNIDGDGATLLKDYSTIQDWAKPSVNTVYNKGYILGYPDGVYMPSKALTRAEAVKIIYEIIENENIERGFNITNYNESYTNAVVVGNLNILDSVGSGNVYLKNVVVLGDIVISADKVNTVQLTDVKAKNIIVENENNPVKIVCNNNISIAKTQLPSVAVIQRLGSNINI